MRTQPSILLRAILIGAVAIAVGAWYLIDHSVDLHLVLADVPQTGARPVPISVDRDGAVDNRVTLTESAWANYHAGSEITDRRALGGFGASMNYARAVESAAALELELPYLLAEPEVVVGKGEHKGMRIFLVNPTDELIAFPALDSWPYIVQEAVDEMGQWRAIEREQTAICGNSVHRLLLPAGCYWTFGAPRYHGSFTTRLRFRLRGPRGALLLSNEFDGGVEPGQFVTGGR